jgi:mRNA interferase RelE/StbE
LVWKIEYADTALKQLKKLDKQTARRILDFMNERISDSTNPRSTGKALAGEMKGLWRYRSGDFRIICDIQDEILHVLVLQIGNRRDIYR